MQILKCNIGIWQVEARVEHVDGSKLMAVISATAKRGDCPIESKHTVVFDHIQGCDQIEETKAMMQRLLGGAH